MTKKRRKKRSQLSNSHTEPRHEEKPAEPLHQKETPIELSPALIRQRQKKRLFCKRFLQFTLFISGISLIWWLGEPEPSEFFKTQLSPDALQLAACDKDLTNSTFMHNCFRASCELAAKLLPTLILNKLPHAVIKILPGNKGLKMSHEISDLEKVDPEIFYIFNVTLNSIHEQDQACTRKRIESNAFLLEKMPFRLSLSSNENNFLEVLNRITSRVGLRDCLGINSFASLILKLQKKITHADFLIRLVGGFSINNFDHTFSQITKTDGTLWGVCDAWNPQPSKNLLSTYCPAEEILPPEEILTATGDTSCSVYHPQLWPLNVINDTLAPLPRSTTLFFQSFANLLINNAMQNVDELHQRDDTFEQPLSCKEYFSIVYNYIT